MKSRKTTTRRHHLRTTKSGKVTGVRQHQMRYLAKFKKNKGVKYLFHKTDARDVPSIIMSNRLRNPISHDPISLSENNNPYLPFIKFEKPVVLVFERDKLEGLHKVEYDEEGKATHDDRSSWFFEKEWFTWNSPIREAIVGVIINGEVQKVPEEVLTDGKFNGEVRIAMPTKFIPAKDLTEGKLNYKLDESKLEPYDRGYKVY